jgi:photosystem II stability/assembly factor-like uncharacterized protein
MKRSYRALCGAVLAGLLIFVAGCTTEPGPAATTGAVADATLHPHGPFPGLHYRDGGTARLTSVPPPASAALPGANDLLAVGAVVLAAGDTGIWRSDDGGATWHQLVGSFRAWSIAAIPGGGYAVLGALPQQVNVVAAPVLATSENGISWRTRRIRAAGASQWPFGYGYRFVLDGLGAAADGVAVPDAGMFPSGSAPSFRTTDGGLRWTPLSLRDASGGLAMVADSMLPDGRTMLATAPGPGSGCAGAVYQSADAGTGWALLPGSCQPYPLQAVQFISAQDGFAGGGMPEKFGGEQLVEATTDGGRTWQARWRTPVENGPDGDNPVLRLDMVSAERGWAVTGGCVLGQNGPCPGTVYATVDGGYRWQRTSQRAIAIASFGTGPGAGRAVTVDDLTQTTSVTTDGGRTWSTRTTPLASITSVFAGVGGVQLWQTSLGYFLSRDGGKRWSAADQLAAPGLDYQTWQAAPPDRLLGYSSGGGNVIRSSGDGGLTWTTATVPVEDPAADQVLAAALGPGATAIAVTGPGAQCLSQAEITKVEQAKPGWKPPAGPSVLYTSADGGARWKTAVTVLPFGVAVVAAAAVDGPRIAVIDACGNLQLSADAGARWRAEALGNGTFCTVSELGAEIWLACQDNSNQNWVLHSADGGSTWTAYRLPAAASGVNGIYATSPGSAVMPSGGSLWRTTHGGTAWTQSWPVTEPSPLDLPHQYLIAISWPSSPRCAGSVSATAAPASMRCALHATAVASRRSSSPAPATPAGRLMPAAASNARRTARPSRECLLAGSGAPASSAKESSGCTS